MLESLQLLWIAVLLIGSLPAQWSLLTPSVPSVRTGSAVAHDDTTGRIALFGGAFPGGSLDDHLWSFDGDRWHLPAVAGARPGPLASIHGSVMSCDAVRGRLVLAVPRADTWEWDGAQWTRLGAAPSGRLLAAVFDGSNVLLVTDDSGLPVSMVQVWRWNGSSWTAASAASAVGSFTPPAVGYDRARQELVLFGGSRTFLVSPPVFDDTMWTWDGTTWSQVPRSGIWPQARIDAAFGWDPVRNRLVLHGGRVVSGSGTRITGDVHEWNGFAWSASIGGPPRAEHALAWDASSARLVTIGGDTTLIDAWDGIAWSRVSNGSAGPGNIFAGGSTIFAVGQGLEAWTGRRWVSIDPTPVDGAGYAFDSGRGVITSLGSQFSHTLEWTQSTGWQQRFTPTLPSRRRSAAFGYDPARQRVVMFGGLNWTGSPVLGDTWEFDGTDWSLVAAASATSPLARRDASIAFDPVTQTMVLVGGSSGFTPAFGDAWMLQNGNWTALPSPPGSGAARLAPDAARNRLVLYRASGPTGSGLIAEWTGTTWQSLGNMLGGADALAFDPITADLIAFTAQAHSPGARFAATATPTNTTYGQGCPAVTQPRLLGDAAYLGHSSWLVDLVEAGPASPCLFGMSLQAATLPLGSCTQLLATPVATTFTLANAHGRAFTTLAIPGAASLRGIKLFVQGAAVQASGLALTAGLEVTVGD